MVVVHNNSSVLFASEEEGAQPAFQAQAAAQDSQSSKGAVPNQIGLKFGSMQINGLEPSKISNGYFEDTIYLNPGDHCIVGVTRKPLKLHVSKKTVAKIHFEIAQKNGEPSLSQGMLEFDRAVTIKNPSAFAPKKARNGAMRSLKNTLFPVGVSRIRLNENGSIKFEGFVSRMGLGFEVTQSIELGKQKSAYNSKTLVEALKKFEAVVDSGIIKSMDYRFGLHAALPSLSMEESNRSSALSECKKMSANRIGFESKGSVSFARQENNDIEIKHKNGTHRLELKDAMIDYGLRVRLDGLASVTLANEKQIFILRRDTQNKTHFLMDGLSTVELALCPSSKTQVEFPRVTPFLRSAAVSLAARGLEQFAAITPKKNGVAEFFSVITNLQGHPRRILSSEEKAPGLLGSAEMKKWIEDICGTKTRSHNYSRLITEGCDALQTRINIADQAEHTLCVQTLVFKDDKEGNMIADALVRAAQRGVKVRVIVDSLGNIEHFEDLRHFNAVYRKMTEGGVDLHCYNNRAERGLRRVLKILQSYPDLAGISDIKELRNPALALRAIHRLSSIACNKIISDKIHPSVPALLAEGLNLLFDGQPGANPQVILTELAKMSEDNILDIPELLSIAERLAHFNNRVHEKYFVADNKRAVVGGRNLASEYLSDNWIDRDEEIYGPIAFDIFSAFSNNWRFMTGEDIKAMGSMDDLIVKDGKDIQIIQHRPVADEDHHIVNVWIAQLKATQAGDKVRIENAYFSPVGVLNAFEAELINAQKRGVDVRVLTPLLRSDSKVLVDGALTKRRILLRAGIRMYETRERMLHAKMSTFGAKVAVLGSSNMDARSAGLNSEDVIIIYDEAGAQEKEQVIERDMENAIELNLKDIEMLPIAQELAAWNAEGLSSLA